MTSVLSEIVVKSIDRMKDRIEWKPSEDIASAVEGCYPQGSRIVIAPNDDRTAFVAVAEVGSRYLSTNGFRPCPILRRIYLHAGGSL